MFGGALGESGLVEWQTARFYYNNKKIKRNEITAYCQKGRKLCQVLDLQECYGKSRTLIHSNPERYT